MPPLKPGGGASSKPTKPKPPEPPRGGPGAKPAKPKPTKPKPTKPAKPAGGPGSTVGTADSAKPTTPAKPTTSGGTPDGVKPATTPTPAPSGGGKPGKPGSGKPDSGKPGKDDVTPTPTPEPEPTPVVVPPVVAPVDTAAQDFKDAQNFAKVFQGLTGLDPAKNPWMASLYTVGKKFVDSNQIGWDDPNIYNLILNDTSSPELQGFRDRFSAYLSVRNERAAAGKPVGDGFGTIADYVKLEGEYQTALESRPAFKGLATQDNIKKFITGTTSVQEVQDRIDNAYFAITTADSALKEQIKQQFPTLNDDDLALTLVTGNTDAVEQKIKFGAAGIAASAKLAGLTSQSDLVDLARQGVTREGALTGFQQVAAERAGIQQASRMFGGTAPTQAELEAEALKTGGESAAANRLRSQARAQFAGQSGITTGSLRRKSQV